MFPSAYAHSAAIDLAQAQTVTETVDLVQQNAVKEIGEVSVVLAIAIIIVGIVWYFLEKNSSSKPLLSQKKSIALARLVTVLVITAVASVSWDLWWHRGVGRETFWQAPHLLLYSTIISGVLCSLYGWYATQEKQWKYVALTLMLIPLSAPFDQLWHTLFGVEDFSRPHLIIWSPPHLTVALSSAFAQIFLLPILRKDRSEIRRRFFGMLVFGTLTATGLYLALPVHPTDGFGQVLGFWGAFFMSMAIIAVPLIGRVWMEDRYGAIKIMFVAISFLLIAYGKETASHVVVVLAHDRMPNWIIVFTNISTAVWLDMSDRYSVTTRGLIGGSLCAGLMFGMTRYFLAPEFFYGADKIGIALISGALGGLVGAKAAQAICAKWSKTLAPSRSSVG